MSAATHHAAQIAERLLARRPAYAPDWRPGEDGPSRALAEVAAAYLDALGERVGRMPDKHLAVLLDMLGVSLLAPQPSGAVVVFTALEGAPASRVPAGTRIGASLPGRDAPLPFETVRAVAVTGAALAEVWTVLPGTDAAADHAPDLAAGRGTTLFAGARRVERALYLGDPVHLALTGRAEIELDVVLRTAASTSLALAWSWWDGTAWQPFSDFVEHAGAGDDDSWDGTAGLTRSGRVRLVTPCARAKPLTIEGIESCWIRARTTVPLPASPDLTVPEVALIGIRTVLSRALVKQTILPGAGGVLTLRAYTPDARNAAAAKVTQQTLSGAGGRTVRTLDSDGKTTFATPAGATIALAFGATPADADFMSALTVTGDLEVALAQQRGLAPDKAVGDEKALDVTRSFQPLGQAPARGAAFYLACDDVFSKPGARVALKLARPRTASEEADATGGQYEGTIQGAQQFIATFATDLTNAADGLAALTAASGLLGQAVPEIVNPGTSTSSWYASAQKAVGDAIAALIDAAGVQPKIWTAVTAAQGHLRAVAGGADPAAAVTTALSDLGIRQRDVARAGADVADALAQLAASPGGLQAAANDVKTALATGADAQIATAQASLAIALGAVAGLTP